MGSQRVGHDRVTEVNWTEEISDQPRKDFYSFAWSVSINYSLTETFYFIYFLVNKEHDRERIVLLITLSTLLKKLGIFSTFLLRWNSLYTRCTLTQCLGQVALPSRMPQDANYNSVTIYRCVHCFSHFSGSEMLVAQSCPTLCDPKSCSLPGFSVHGILQARILEWVAIAFSRGSSQPWDQTQVSCIAGRFFTVWATGKSF